MSMGTMKLVFAMIVIAVVVLVVWVESGDK